MRHSSIHPYTEYNYNSTNENDFWWLFNAYSFRIFCVLLSIAFLLNIGAMTFENQNHFHAKGDEGYMLEQMKTIIVNNNNNTVETDDPIKVNLNPHAKFFFSRYPSYLQ